MRDLSYLASLAMRVTPIFSRRSFWVCCMGSNSKLTYWPDKGFKKVICYSDSLQVVQLVHDGVSIVTTLPMRCTSSVTFLPDNASVPFTTPWGKATSAQTSFLSWEPANWIGGMGFRSLKAFNVALLAKQGCRILNNPESLLARRLKAWYFPMTGFLKAKTGFRLLLAKTWAVNIGLITSTELKTHSFDSLHSNKIDPNSEKLETWMI